MTTPYWPVERFIARRKCKPEVASRLRRLNPSGVPEGSWPRGYRPGPRNYTFDLGSIGPRDFVRQYGRAAYDAVPKRYIYRKGHRKSVAREYAEDFLQQAED